MKLLRELLRDRRLVIGAVMLFMLAVIVFLSLFSPYEPSEWQVAPRDMSPSWEHFWGTNSKGQDVFWQMTFALRNSLALAVSAAVISRVIALMMGMVSGYSGGVVDRVLMFITDTFLVIPLFLIVLLLAMLAREYMNILVLALLLGFFGWAWDARLIRSEILSLREREFTYTAILSGTPTYKLIFKEYFPFITPLVFATLINNMIWVVGMEMTLAIIGVTSLNTPTLGSVLKIAIDSMALLLGQWWLLVAPIGIGIIVFVSLYLISLGISEYLDPKARFQRVGAK